MPLFIYSVNIENSFSFTFNAINNKYFAIIFHVILYYFFDVVFHRTTPTAITIC